MRRPDECCGFGGTFSVFEEVVSAKMGYDKVTDHVAVRLLRKSSQSSGISNLIFSRGSPPGGGAAPCLAGAEYIVSADSSCLMHQRGCAERIGVPIKFIHIAQILNGASA